MPILTTQSARGYGLGTVIPITADDYEFIGAVTATGSESSFDITIPSTYKHLQIRSLTRDSRTNTNAPLWIQPNNDTTNSNYAVIYMYSYSTTSTNVGNGYSTSEGGISAVGAGGGSGGAGTDIFGGGVTTIFDYNDTNKWKSWINYGAVTNNNSGDELTANSGGMWKNTNAITSLYFRPFTSPFKANSVIAVYGLKG